MSKTKMKLVTMLLTLVMLFTLCVPAYAAETYTITITNSTTGYSYEAYQVFAGDYTNGVLSNVVWGGGVDSTALLAELKQSTTTASTGINFTSCTDAASVADKISNATLSLAQTEALAKIINNHLGATASGTATAPDEHGNYVIAGLNGGYYMVVNDTSPEEAPQSRFLLQVVGNVNVVPKVDTPTVDKKIVNDDETETSFKTVSIGDTVHFRVTSEVPNMTGYTKYFFIMNDTMSKGLTYSGNNTLAITVGGNSLTKDTDYSVSFSTDENGITTLKIVFKDFLNNYSDQVGDEILITYDALLNSNAATGINPNTNEVVLNYSNDPSFVPDGTDEPGETDPPIGESPKAKSYVYTTSLTINKEDETGEPINGAEFTLTGTAMNIVVVVEDEFVEDELGIYYRLKDGTYTQEDPTGDPTHDEPYESTETLYSIGSKTTIKGKGQTNVDVKGTAVNGTVVFTGLGEGIYTLTESVTPDGYNTMKPITFRVNAKYNTLGEPTFTITDAEGKQAVTGFAVNNGAVTATIQNFPGSTLPVTGGIGTTLFYLIGGILAVGAGVLLITKRRMRNTER